MSSSTPSAFPRSNCRPTATPSSSPPSAPTGTSKSSAPISGSIATTRRRLADPTHAVRPRLRTEVVARRHAGSPSSPSARPPPSKSDDSDSDSDSKDEAASQIYLISPNGGEAFPVTAGRRRCSRLLLVRRFADDLLRHAPALDQGAKRRLQESNGKTSCNIAPPNAATRSSRSTCARALARHAAAPAKAVEERRRARRSSRPHSRHPRHREPRRLRVDHLAHLARRPQARLRQQRHQPAPGKIRRRGNLRMSAPRPQCGRRIASAGPAAPHHPQPGRGNPPALGQRQPPHLLQRRSRRRHRPLPRPAAASLLGRHRSTATVEQWAKDFIGPVEHYAVAADNVLDLRAPRHRSPDVFRRPSPPTHCTASRNWPGTYANISVAAALAESRLRLLIARQARRSLSRRQRRQTRSSPPHHITSTRLFTERDLPQGKPYQWKADDGTTVEGMLIYPPGKFEAKHLPMFTLHPRRSRRRRRQSLRSRLVPVGRARRHQRMARLRAQLPRFHRIRRQVPDADRSRQSSRVPAKTFSKASTRW